MCKFKTEKLRWVVVSISRGITPLYTHSDGIYVINQKCIRDGRVSFNEIKISKNKPLSKEKIVEQSDTLICSTGVGTLGRVGRFNDFPENKIITADSHVTIVKADKTIAFPLFLSYVLISKQSDIEALAKGSTGQTELSKSELALLDVPLPPLEVQRKIAGILGALDDKIEVLREQNKTLEQMAQAVFQSWFVDFDIVRAKVAGMPIADICKKYRITPDICDLFPSAFTPDNLPLGWEKKQLMDMGSIVGGGTPATENKDFFAPAGSSVSWITPKDLSGYIGKYISCGSTDISEKGLKESSAKLMPKGTVLFSSRAPIGYCVIAENDISTNQGFKSVVPNNSSYTEYIYQFLKNNVDMISGYATGSTFKEVSGSIMKQIPILKPTEDLLIRFEEMVRSLNQKNKENSKQIRTLKQTRDALLPQLLGGKIDV